MASLYGHDESCKKLGHLAKSWSPGGRIIHFLFLPLGSIPLPRTATKERAANGTGESSQEIENLPEDPDRIGMNEKQNDVVKMGEWTRFSKLDLNPKE